MSLKDAYLCIHSFISVSVTRLSGPGQAAVWASQVTEAALQTVLSLALAFILLFHDLLDLLKDSLL